MKKILKKWRVVLSILLVVVIAFGVMGSNTVKADTEDVSDTMNNNTFDSSKPETAQQIISGNTYKIVSALDSSYVWNVRGNSYYNGRNLLLYKDSGINAQKFVFIKQKDGSYKIKSTNSSKMLESDREGNTEGANVCQYDNNNAENQLWNLIPTEDGYYYFENKSNGLVAGVTGAQAANNVTIKMYNSAETDRQKFQLVATDPFANATYKIVSALNSSYVWHIKSGSVNDGATVHLYEDNDNINTPKFVLTKQKDGYYTIENTNSGKMIECKGAGKSNGTDICQNKNTNNTAQQWKLVPTEDGYYYLQNRCNGLMADVAGGKAGNNVNIQMYKSNKTASQKFQIMVTFPIVNGTYVLESALNSSYVWDIAGAAKTDKINLQLYKYNESNAQKFVIKKHYGEWDYYTIQNVNSGKLVECNGKKQKNGVNIWQYSQSSTVDTAQLWKPVSAGNGYYYLQNYYNGLVAGVSGSKAVNKANIQLYKVDNNNSLKFKFANPSNKKANSTSSSKYSKTLETMANGSSYNGVYKVGTKYSGPYKLEQCKGFAKSVHQKLFGYIMGKTMISPNNYKINISSSKTKSLGSITAKSSTNDIKNLFSKARPGDFVQIRRTHGGSHSAIVYSVSSSDVTFFEANLDNNNTIYKKSYTWKKLRDSNQAISVYTAVNY